MSKSVKKMPKNFSKRLPASSNSPRQTQVKTQTAIVPAKPQLSQVAKMYNMMAAYNSIIAPRSGIDGIEVDPNQTLSYQTQKQRDKRAYTLDAKRCVLEHEVTADAIDPSSPKKVIRQFWTAPGPRVSEEEGGLFQYDSRGNMTKLESFQITVKNLTKSPIRFIATSCRALNDDVDTVHLRASLAKPGTWIQPGATRSFRSKAGMNSNYYWTQDATTGQYVYHVMDGYVVIPDSPPQDQSQLMTEVVNPQDGDSYTTQTRIWDPQAEVAEITTEAIYHSQTNGQSDVFYEDSAYRLSFSADLSLPYKVSIPTRVQNGKSIPVKTVMSEYAYSTREEGWAGLGTAIAYDADLDISFAYIAKFPQQGPVKKTGKPIKKKNSLKDSDFPAFRAKSLENNDVTVFFHSGFCYGADADGNDLHTYSSTYKWSETYGAFINWDHSRGSPVIFKDEWDYPNYYSTWVASYPSSGAISIMREESLFGATTTVGLVDPSVLIDSSIAWELVLSVATSIITAIIKIAKDISDHNAKSNNNGGAAGKKGKMIKQST